MSLPTRLPTLPSTIHYSRGTPYKAVPISVARHINERAVQLSKFYVLSNIKVSTPDCEERNVFIRHTVANVNDRDVLPFLLSSLRRLVLYPIRLIGGLSGWLVGSWSKTSTP